MAVKRVVLHPLFRIRQIAAMPRSVAVEEDRSDDVERIDELEFLARVVTQLPEPRKHSIRYYGYYAAVVRARRRQANAEAEASMPAAGNDAVGNVTSEARGNVAGVHSAVAVRSAVCSEPIRPSASCSGSAGR